MESRGHGQISGCGFSDHLPGSYVVCAITGRPITIDELKYWSVDRQEPMSMLHASLEAEKRAGNLPNQKR